MFLDKYNEKTYSLANDPSKLYLEIRIPGYPWVWVFDYGDGIDGYSTEIEPGTGLTVMKIYVTYASKPSKVGYVVQWRMPSVAVPKPQWRVRDGTYYSPSGGLNRTTPWRNIPRIVSISGMADNPSAKSWWDKFFSSASHPKTPIDRPALGVDDLALADPTLTLVGSEPGNPGGGTWFSDLLGSHHRGPHSGFAPPGGGTNHGGTDGGPGGAGDNPAGWRDLFGNDFFEGSSGTADRADRPQAGPYQQGGTDRQTHSSDESSRGTGRYTFTWDVYDPNSGYWTAEQPQANAAPGNPQGGMPDPNRDPSGLTGNPIVDTMIMRQAMLEAGMVAAPLGPSRALRPDSEGSGTTQADFNAVLAFDPLAPLVNPTGTDYEGPHHYPPRSYRPGRSPYMEALYPEGDPHAESGAPMPVDPHQPPPGEGGDPHVRVVSYTAGVRFATMNIAAGRISPTPTRG